jgi:pyruvate kinase
MKDSLQFIRTSLEHLNEKLSRVSMPSSAAAKIHPQNKSSAQNLLQYLTLRNNDIRELQDLLHGKGLSSLASSESHIQRQLQEILLRIGAPIPASALNHCDFQFARKKMQQRSHQLFGHNKQQQHAAIMVTFDNSFADDEQLIQHLLKQGMNTARINCAHDDEAVWLQMIERIKKASRDCKIPCTIYMDLAGPKIRTILPHAAENGKIKVKEGDIIYLTENGFEGSSTKKKISCTQKDIVKQLRKNNLVMFDDGLIEATVNNIKQGEAELLITKAAGKKANIKAEKGINFPDTILNINPLTSFDKKVLPFVMKHANIIGCSFIRTAEDVKQFQKVIRKTATAKQKPLLVYKIETTEAVLNLPHILLQGLTEPNFGIMIARGDLAVEIGFERMSEIQEEILWICEAAHTPVIWATQVLETLNKTGIATRSEITDAFRSSQAECVMLNKGAYILNAMDTLKDILQRSGGHHIKKRYTFRTLKIAENFFRNK